MPNCRWFPVLQWAAAADLKAKRSLRTLTTAVWTDRDSSNAIEWKLDGKTYSVSGLIACMLGELKLYEAGSIAR